MANVKKANRVQDADIRRLNHVGLGLKAIADHLGCHAATITMRLKAMGIDPIDTRRSFMERVFQGLTPAEQDWLSHNLYNAGIGVKEFVTTLIREAYMSTPAVTTAAPPAMPAMLSGGQTAAEKNQEGSQQVHENLTIAAEVQVAPEYVKDTLEAPVAEEAAQLPATPKSLFSTS